MVLTIRKKRSKEDWKAKINNIIFKSPVFKKKKDQLIEQRKHIKGNHHETFFGQVFQTWPSEYDFLYLVCVVGPVKCGFYY